VALALAGCNGQLGILQSKTIDDRAVQDEALQGEAMGVLNTPEGEVGVIRRAPIPSEDLCYARSRYMRNVWVPRRCSSLLTTQ
jgi:hypothetical protein